MNIEPNGSIEHVQVSTTINMSENGSVTKHMNQYL